jgi:hypothetical protein
LQEALDFSLVDIPPDLTAVFQRLLAKEPSNRYRDASATLAALCAAMKRPLPPETNATRESFLQAAPFIGRTTELYQLEAGRRQAVAGRGSGLLVSGESGIGKSRLLQELRTRALVDGMLVLRGQAQQNGGAYHLWVEAIRPLLLHTAPDDLEAAVLQAIVPNAARLLERPVPTAPPYRPRRPKPGSISQLWICCAGHPPASRCCCSWKICTGPMITAWPSFNILTKW